jgi:8-oxo-dGTP diphosphatase
LKNISTVTLVVAAALVDHRGKVLMQQRHEGRVHGGLWEFPGGKVEPGEVPESALVREIREELGLAIAESDLHPAAFSSGASLAGGAGNPIVILLYTCMAWQGVPEPIDAAAIEWIDLARIGDLAMPPLDYPLWEALMRRNKTLAIGG